MMGLYPAERIFARKSNRAINLLTLSYAPQFDGTFVNQEYQLSFLPVFYYRINF